MAVTPAQPKSQPDVSKLNTFISPTLTVTKHLSARTVNGQMVISPQRKTVKEILDLMATLPLSSGPGHYYFKVADEGGSADDEWMVRLGPEIQEGSMLPGSPSPSPFSGSPGAPMVGPLGDGVRQIGPGYFYDENLGTLVTPWRSIVQWRPGEALPTPPSNATTATPAAAATAWPATNVPGWGNWGGYPVDDSKTKALETQIAEMTRRQEMDALREEQRRREEDQRRREEERDRREQQRQEEQRREFNALIERLTAKPTGPNEAEVALRRQVEEMNRKLEEQQREETRRRELQLQEERFRAELRAQQEKTDAILHELKATPKNDPMMAVMTTILSGAQQQASDAVRAIRESSERTATAQERHTTQIMEAMRTDKTGAAEMAKTMLENTRNMVELQGSVYQQMLEQASSGGAPWYADAIQNATKQIGAVAAAIGSRAQQQQQPQMVRQPQMQAPRPAVRRAPAITQPIPTLGAPLPPVPPVSPVQNTTGGRPDGTEYDPETDEFVLVGGHRVKPTVVQQHGWAKTIAALARQQTMPDPVATAAAQVPPQVIASHLRAVPAEPVAVNMNGAGGPATHAPSPAATKRPSKSKKLKPGAASVAPSPPPAPPVEPDVVVPPPADPVRGYNRDELKALDTDQVLAVVRAFPDELFFGALFEYVEQLRTAMPEPATAAQYIAQGYAQLNTAGTVVPATELLMAEQINAIVERLFPGASEDYTNAVAVELARAMGLEIIDEDEEGTQA